MAAEVADVGIVMSGEVADCVCWSREVFVSDGLGSGLS